MTASLWKWTRPPNIQEARGRADVVLLAAIEGGDGEWLGSPIKCSRNQIQRLIDEGSVKVNGASIKSGTKILGGSRIEIRFPLPASTDILPEDLPIDILFQDDHLLVVNKPPGLTVHPSPTQLQGTLVNALLHQVKIGKIRDLSGVGGIMRPGIVHRLDKDTSGALVISKSDVAHRKLVEIFSKHAIDRKYWALCYGTTAKKSGTIETTIARNPKDRKKMAVNVPGGRNAVTDYRRLEEYARAESGAGSKPFACWIEATLETGRTHQVRVHLTSLGNSLMGDPVYGAPTTSNIKWLALPDEVRELINALPGQALHARVLGFNHPVTGEKLHFEASPPETFKRLFEALKKYS